MTLRHPLGTVGAAVAAAMIATATQAAPVTGSAVDLGAAAREWSLADRVASPRCWRRNGKRHCVNSGPSRVSRYRGGGSDYYEHIPEKLPYGSQAWWDQMLRDNRAGNPGGGGRD